MRRLALAGSLAATLAACADGQRQLAEPVRPLGDFKLGFSEVVAPNLVKGPLSREASTEAITAAVDAAIEQRMGRLDGGKFYHIGTSVEAYILAQPGVPVVLSPKSALIVRVTVWDDAAQAKLNPEPAQFTVLESASAETLFGSGLTLSGDQQLRILAANAALRIETWLRAMQREKGWFGPVPDAAPDDDPESAG